jgi:hypothetical protein
MKCTFFKNNTNHVTKFDDGETIRPKSASAVNSHGLRHYHYKNFNLFYFSTHKIDYSFVLNNAKLFAGRIKSDGGPGVAHVTRTRLHVIETPISPFLHRTRFTIQ